LGSRPGFRLLPGTSVAASTAPAGSWRSRSSSATEAAISATAQTISALRRVLIDQYQQPYWGPGAFHAIGWYPWSYDQTVVPTLWGGNPRADPD